MFLHLLPCMDFELAVPLCENKVNMTLGGFDAVGMTLAVFMPSLF